MRSSLSSTRRPEVAGLVLVIGAALIAVAAITKMPNNIIAMFGGAILGSAITLVFTGVLGAAPKAAAVKEPETEEPEAGAPPAPPPHVLAAVESPTVDAPEVEAPIFDEPQAETPSSDAPEVEASAFDAPQFDAPQAETPEVETPQFDAPEPETPSSDAPEADAPAVETPTFEEAAFGTAAADAPASETPEVKAPTFEEAAFGTPAVETPEEVERALETHATEAVEQSDASEADVSEADASEAVEESDAEAPAAGQREEILVDPVTGLANATRLQKDLEIALDGAHGDLRSVLYVFALNGMQEYRDAYGDPCRDALVALLAQKLTEAVAGRGTAYHLGDERFAVLGTGPEELTSQLRGTASGAVYELGDGFVISSSMGEVTLPEEASSPEQALELANGRVAAQRGAAPNGPDLSPPHDPMDAMRLVRPRYDIAALVTRIGRRMGVPEAQLDDLEAAAQLRDVGNMGLPRALLSRAGKLAGNQWDFIRLHTLAGERLLAASFDMEHASELVRSSHERWDGGGYPDGLAGEDIPLGARIVFVCSAFQDMTSERPHRPALETNDALSELDRGAGTQFDPSIVPVFKEEFEAARERAVMGSAPKLPQPMRVLVADNDPVARFLLQRAIETTGHECVAVEDGLQGWETFLRAMPDIVIAEWQMPNLGGEELCRRIREDPAGSRTCFVMSVALQESEHVQSDALPGVDGLLKKPFERHELNVLLDTAARGASLERQSN